MKQLNKARRGTGGAHIGYSMFGARGPCLAPEDDPAGSAGGSPGGTSDPPDHDDPPLGDKPDGKPDAELRFTQADVDRMIKERIDRERRSQQRQKPAPENNRSESKGSKPDADARLIYEFQDELEAVLEGTGLKPKPGLKRRMRDDFIRERPNDPNGWITSYLQDVGLEKPTSSPDNNKQAKGDDVTDPKRGNGAPPISDKGPPAPGGGRDPDVISLERPLELTAADIERLQAKHGFDKANAMIMTRINAALRTMRLTVDPRRKQ